MNTKLLLMLAASTLLWAGCGLDRAVPLSADVDLDDMSAEQDDAVDTGEEDPDVADIVEVVEEVVEPPVVLTPDLTVESVQAGPSSTFDLLTEIVINLDVVNIGSAAVESANSAVYVQIDDDEFDPSVARRVATLDLVSIGFEPDNSSWPVRDLQIALPRPIDAGDSGEKLVWVFVVVDPDGDIIEGNPDDEPNPAELNNVAVAVNAVRVYEPPLCEPDIVLIDFDLQPRELMAGSQFEVTVELANWCGPGRSFFCSAILSTDETAEPEDLPLTNVDVNGDFGPDGLATVSATRVFPDFIPPGDYYTFLMCDPSDVIPETFEDNNLARLSGTVHVGPE